MNIFKPTTKKLIAPLVLLILSVVPSFLIRSLVFEILAIPFGGALDIFRYQDKPFLTPVGAIIVGTIWAIILYIIICLIATKRKK